MAYILAFPKEEQKLYTRITFYEYRRVRPGDSVPDASIKGSIRLPLPISLPDQYSVNLNTSDFGMSGFLLDTLQDIYTAGGGISNMVFGGGVSAMFDAAMQGVTNIGSDIISQGRSRGLTNSIAALAALAPGSLDLQNYARAKAGVVRNPQTTTVFNNVNLRQHSFSFKLSPRNQDDATELRNIIEQIKIEMHPKTAIRGFALEFPSLVKIQFEGENILATPVYYSFISSFNPNYTGAGKPAYFKDGTPISVQLDLSIQEINVLTRESFTGENVDLSGINREPPTSTSRTNDGRLAGPV